MKQPTFLKPAERSYGGILQKKRKGRIGPRPLATKKSMHLVLRSSKATQAWSFQKPNNRQIVRSTLRHFSNKFGVKLISVANVGNHLHLHIQLSNRFTYVKWIRAVTAAIAVKVTGIHRWTGGKTSRLERFWDYRPFTRIIQSYRDFLNVSDYILVNQLEGAGLKRELARLTVADWKLWGRDFG